MSSEELELQHSQELTGGCRSVLLWDSCSSVPAGQLQTSCSQADVYSETAAADQRSSCGATAEQASAEEELSGSELAGGNSDYQLMGCMCSSWLRIIQYLGSCGSTAEVEENQVLLRYVMLCMLILGSCIVPMMEYLVKLMCVVQPMCDSNEHSFRRWWEP